MDIGDSRGKISLHFHTQGKREFFFSSRVKCTCTFYANLCHVLILLCGLEL